MFLFASTLIAWMSSSTMTSYYVETFIFPVQLTTCRIVNLIRLIHTLLNMMTMYIHAYVVHFRACVCASFSDSLSLNSLL